MDLIVSLGLLGTLVAVIYFDLRQMRIPNVISMVVVALFLASAFALPPSEIGLRVAQSVIVLLICFVAFMFHTIGGGDVKILTALALFIPLGNASAILLVFSASLLVGTAAIMLCRRMNAGGRSSWAFLTTTKMPMGLPIGLAGLVSVGWAL